MSILVLTSDTLIGTPATGNIEYNGQFFGTDSNASRAQMQRITQGTAVASTSGTYIDFTGLPAWVKRITISFNGVSLSGTSQFLFQIGSGSITTTGYSGGGMRYGGTTTASASYTTGLSPANFTAAATYSGHIVWTNVSGNIWAGSANLGASGGTESGCIGGSSVSLSGALDRVRITTVNGTDTFDAGSINILYEG